MAKQELTTAPEAGLKSFDDYQSAIDVRAVTGSAALVDKEQLAGRELVITEVQQNQSDSVTRADDNGVIRPGTFVSCVAVLRNPITLDGETVNRVVFNDGGAGIPRIVEEFIKKTQPAELDHLYVGERVTLEPVIYCKHGLRPSTYKKQLSDGSTTEATTWYLA